MYNYDHFMYYGQTILMCYRMVKNINMVYKA